MPAPHIKKLGILAGKGALPAQLANHCEAQRIPYFMIAFEESLDPDVIAGRDHEVISLGQIGRGIATLKAQDVTDVVMAGHIKRPSLRKLHLDAQAKALLKKLGMNLLGGDDALLRALMHFFEEQGLTVLAAHEILGGLTVSAGVLTKASPDSHDAESIAKAFTTLQHMSALDIGQSLVIEDGLILSVEAAEGTDELIARTAAYAKSPGHSILVKAKKNTQDTRADMPTIGPNTIRALAKHSYAGVAIEADSVLIVERDEVVALANTHGLFVVAV